MLVLLLDCCSSSCDGFLCSFFLVWYPNSTEASLALRTFRLEIILSSSHNLMGWMIATAFSPTSRCIIGEKLDGLDQSPLSECFICYCKVCRYSGIFAVREVFFLLE